MVYSFSTKRLAVIADSKRTIRTHNDAMYLWIKHLQAVRRERFNTNKITAAAPRRKIVNL